ncbi:MAG: S8 family serine peptidase [Anaerolineales bacterium]|nr:S8 family serine peptidase [Anaerolineales bacterium]
MKVNWRSIPALLLILSLVLTSVTPVFAQDATPATPDTATRLFLPAVLSDSQTELAQTPQPTPGPLTPGDALAPESSESAVKPEVAASTQRSPDQFQLASVIVVLEEGADPAPAVAAGEGQVVHRYTKVFNGVSMVMPEGNIGDVASSQGVKAVFLDELRQPDTDASPAFIGAPAAWAQLGGQESAGEGVIVGILDSGVWPEHPSVSDPDPSGKPYAAPPVVPGSNGFSGGVPRSTCDFGDTAWNPNDAAFSCNNKLIGAYDFIDTYKAFVGLLPTEFDSARDDNGHGTHTLTTSAGNAGVSSSIFGESRGVVSGIAPRAHVIAYRVCGDGGCYGSDSIAAVEQAILDGVNVINFSISGGNAPYGDAVELAFLNAYDNGVFVAASAGNSGPAPETVAHRGPWVTTVAASTSDRHFLSTLTLTANNGDTLNLVGATVTPGISTPLPVVLNTADPLCLNPAAPGAFTGQIVVCERGVNARVNKSYNVSQGGAAGMILRNLILQGLNTDNHFIPSVHIDGPEGDQMIAFFNAHAGVMATFTPGTATQVQGDVIASFSSRGGPQQLLGVSKPDITAPGVQILAGHTPLPATEDGGYPGQLFQAIQGTSMSSPHIAGVGALLKDLHPDWTPGQIKSAIMTTAKVAGVVKEDGVTPADSFDTGSGRVDVAAATNPGFTFDETKANYVALEKSLWNANYPSLYLPDMAGKITVQRTIRSVDNRARNWKVSVSAPPDVNISLPKQIRLNPGEALTFDITIDARYVPMGQVRFAMIEFKQGDRSVHFPVTLVRGEPNVNITKSCDPAVIARGAKTTCTVTLKNTTFDTAEVDFFDQLPPQLSLDPNSVVNAGVWGNSVVYKGPLAGAQPAIVTIGADPGGSPAGYLPLSIFGIGPIAGVGDETITNFTVPAFTYAGETWTRIGLVSNGYIVVGGGTSADINFANQIFPNPLQPNNVLAPYWTDLNPAAGGAMRIATLTDGVSTWLIVEWDAVPEYSTGRPNSFQVWITLGAVEDITFTYGSVNNGDGGFLTVGAENRFGNSGQNYYADGAGSLPVADTELRVTSVPGAPGETRVITYQATGVKKGVWSNCGILCSPNVFQGDNIACFIGQVTGR